MKHYRAVVLSPHLDDAVFSCAGAIRRLRREGPVLVINIFTRYLAKSTLKHGVPLVDSRHDEDMRWLPKMRQRIEDVPYCCIPYSASYRTRQVGSAAAGTVHNGAASDTGAWLGAIDNYRHTPLMHNIQPWIVRLVAVPAVAVYFWRLLRANRMDDAQVPPLRLTPSFEAIDDGFVTKVKAMQLYTSQFKEFYHSGEDCAKALRDYAATISPGVPGERRWKFID